MTKIFNRKQEIKMAKKIIITIPAYNEEQALPEVIGSIKSSLEKSKHKSAYNILVADDGSSDNTAKIAKSLGAIVVSHPRNYGLAETFRTEIKKCLEFKADIIVHFDADSQYKAEEIPKLLSYVEQGYDLVLGSRFLGKIESMPLIKKLGNRAFSRVISGITKIKITDAQTGFRAFTKEVAERLQIISNHTYTQEQIIRAVKEKFRIIEVPVYFAKRKDNSSRLIRNPFEYAVKAWINILRVYRDYEPLKFFGAIGLCLLGVGFIIGMYFLYLHLTIGITGHLGLLMLMILSTISGIQIMVFGFLADMNAK